MVDVAFYRSRNATTYWLIGETNEGRRWVRKHFDTTPGYITLEDLESYIASAQQEDLTVEVY